jgi:hypothetical protein
VLLALLVLLALRVQLEPVQLRLARLEQPVLPVQLVLLVQLALIQPWLVLLVQPVLLGPLVQLVLTQP